MFILSPSVYKSFNVFRNGMNSLKRNFFLNSISKLRLAFLQILSFPDESGVEQYFMLERKKGRRMRRRVVVVGEEHFRPEQSNAFIQFYHRHYSAAKDNIQACKDMLQNTWNPLPPSNFAALILIRLNWIKKCAALFRDTRPNTCFARSKWERVFLCMRVHEGKWISLVEGQVWQ